MSLPILLLILFAFLLVGLLVWALRSPERPVRPAVDVFEALSRPRHCSRISHVMQALQPQDTEYLRETGQPELMQTSSRHERIALSYLISCRQSSRNSWNFARFGCDVAAQRARNESVEAGPVVPDGCALEV
jgi:hypothetical protein